MKNVSGQALPLEGNRGFLDFLLVAGWALVWNMVVGHRGIFAFDQSQLFDSGWRIVAGQVPYKDFLMAFGPVAPAVQAVFFKVFGVSWSAMVLSASVINVLAALSTMRTVRLLWGAGGRWPGVIAGLLVGTAFQATYGTIMFEECAFLCLLVGIQLIVERMNRPVVSSWVAFALGLLGGLSFLGKQNAGVLTIAAFWVLLIVTTDFSLKTIIRLNVWYFSGVVFALGSFAAWLFVYSDPKLFWRHAVEVPAAARAGIAVSPGNLFPPLLFTRVVGTTQWCLPLAFGSVWLAVWHFCREASVRVVFQRNKSARVWLALAAGLPVVQALFQVSTQNGYQNVVFFSVWILFSAVGLLKMLPSVDTYHVFRWFFPVVALFLFIEMAHNAWARRIHDVFPMRVTTGRVLQSPGMEHVRWLDPTLPDGVPIAGEDIDDVYQFLMQRGRTFLLLGESTFLYGITGTVPPTPMLYFQTGHYYNKGDFARLDAWMLSEAKRRDVQIVIRERHTLCFDFPFPEMKHWFEANFRLGPVFGNYEVYERIH